SRDWSSDVCSSDLGGRRGRGRRRRGPRLGRVADRRGRARRGRPLPMSPPRGRGRTLRRVLPHPLHFVLVAAVPAVASVPEPAAAQAPASVRAVCVEAGGSWDRCTDAAVAARALMADAGLVAGLGSEIAGSASTLGRRIGSRPRLAWSLRVSGALAELPDVFAEPDLRAGTISYLLPAFHLG